MIDAVTPANYGFYSCETISAAGNHSATTYLDVRAKVKSEISAAYFNKTYNGVPIQSPPPPIPLKTHIST